MSTYNYVVVSKKNTNISTVNSKLTQPTSKQTYLYIPERAVETSSIDTSLSTRVRIYKMSASEAKDLLNDSDVLTVEILPDLGTISQPEDLSPEQSGSSATLTGLVYTTASSYNGNYMNGGPPDNFVVTNSYPTSSLINAGLKLIQQRNTVGVINFDFVDDNITNFTNYNSPLDGSGVDIIISDPGCKINHADFKDFEGNSRFIELDWNEALGLTSNQTNYSSTWYNAGGYHGTYMAGVCAGTVSGVAKGATLYFMRTYLGNEGKGPTNGYPPSTWAVGMPQSYELARLFHESKSINSSTGYKRPTIFVQSMGVSYQQTIPSNTLNDGYTHIVSKSIGGTITTATTSPANLSFGIATEGIIRADTKHPARNSILDIPLEEMCDAGVIFVGAAGNANSPMFVSGNLEDPDFDPFNNGWYNSTYYDDYYAFDVDSGGYPAHTPIYYMRGSSPICDKAIKVAALTTNGYYDSSSFNIAPYSNKGPRIDIVAPSTVVTPGYGASAFNWVSSHFNPSHAVESNRKLGLGGTGTSFAGPMAAGVIALYLQLNPQATSLDIKKWLRSNASIITGSTSFNFRTNALPPSGEIYPPLYGTPTQSVLYSPFNSPEIGKLEGNFGSSINLINL